MRKNPNNELKYPPKKIQEWVTDSKKESLPAAIRSVMKKTIKTDVETS